MNFKILNELTKQTEQIEPISPPKKEPTTEPIPERKIPWQRLKKIIDDVGYTLATKTEMKDNEKIARWVTCLKWALPLIPDEHQQAKSQIRSAINNPSIWDFTEKPRK